MADIAELAYSTASADRFCEVFREVLVNDIVISAKGGIDSVEPHILHNTQSSPATREG